MEILKVQYTFKISMYFFLFYTLVWWTSSSCSFGLKPLAQYVLMTPKNHVTPLSSFESLVANTKQNWKASETLWV